MTTETETIQPQPGDVLHILAGGLMLFGQAYRRGDTLVLQPDHFERSRDRHGDSWLSDLSEEAQVSRWGAVKLGIGRFPSDLPTWSVVGDPVWVEQYAAARAAAYAQPSQTGRDDALRELRQRFGAPPTTSRTVKVMDSSPEQRAAAEQRARLDAEGVKARSVYGPPRREV